jgi:hypothetical protein
MQHASETEKYVPVGGRSVRVAGRAGLRLSWEGWVDRVEWTHLAEEDGSEPWSAVKGEEFLDWLSDRQLLKQTSAVQTQFSTQLCGTDCCCLVQVRAGSRQRKQTLHCLGTLLFYCCYAGGLVFDSVFRKLNRLF